MQLGLFKAYDKTAVEPPGGQLLKMLYEERWNRLQHSDKKSVYEQIKVSYNSHPNGADLLFLCRACYGGVVRFRQTDGYMSTPCGPHRPIPPASFAKRVDQWHERTRGTAFALMDFEEAMNRAARGSLVYCDPPYRHTQRILYGAQEFSLGRLWDAVGRCKSRGVYVALSIDGSKRSGSLLCS